MNQDKTTVKQVTLELEAPTYLSRVAAALFLTSSIFSLLFNRPVIVSAFFLTLIPTSFIFGSTYSKPVSDFKIKEAKIEKEKNIN